MNSVSRSLHQLLGGCRAEQADPSGGVRGVVRHGALAGQCLDDRRAQRLRHREQLLPGVQGARAGQDRDLLTGVQHVGQPLQVLLAGPAGGVQPDRRRGRRTGRADFRPGILACRGHLDVVRHGQVGHPAPGIRGAHGDVHQCGQLRRVVDHLVVDRDVLVEPVEVHFLLVAGAQHRGFLHASDGQHRHVIQLGVVEPVQQVDATWTRRGQADADLPRGLGVGGRHERGRLFVMDQHELDPVLMTAEAFHDAVDAVARKAEDGVHAPVSEPLDQSLGCDLCHLRTSN